MSSSERGPLVLAVPQTFRRSNWPFLAFLLFLGAVLALPAWLMGNQLIAGLLLLLGVGVAFVVFVVERLVRRSRTELLAVFEGGLLFEQRDEFFVPWAEIERLEQWTETVDSVVDEEVTLLRAITRDGRTLSLRANRETLDAVVTLSRLQPTPSPAP